MPCWSCSASPLRFAPPALRSLKIACEGKPRPAAGDVIAARVAAAASRNLAWFTFGFAGALALLLSSSSS
jgi:hypothetical protein